jgi:mannose-6-phosphate isomerase-like protein (cupin superfamily)
MNSVKALDREACKTFTPRMFAVNHKAGEKLSPEVQKWLDPVNPASYHYWSLAKEKATDLHYHDYDEYWTWVKGRTLLQIRLPDGRSDKFEIGPGWIVYCVRGVEHGHTPLEDWECFEWTGITHEGGRKGHLVREI